MLDMERAWQAVLGELQLQVNRYNFETWLEGSRAAGVEGDTLVVAVSTSAIRDWLETHYLTLVRKTLRGILGTPLDVQFVVEEARAPAELRPLEALAAFPDQPVTGRARARRGTAPSTTSKLNPKYTFETFVVGTGNRLAHAACTAVAESPSKAYNPLFIYGGVGLGKTHLLHAVGNASVDKSLRVIYVSAETFTNELIHAIRERSTDSFRNKYRRTDVFLIDDIQFVASKERTQEEFFHTFNAVHEAGGQIVLSSDRAPAAIPTLEGRLRSRFEWGLLADIQPPDLETRIAILESKLNGTAVDVPREVLAFVAERVQSNVRELEGLLTRVLAYAKLENEPIAVELAAAALHDVLRPAHRARIGPEDILQATTTEFGVPVAALKGNSRQKQIALARHAAMYLLREETDLSLTQIGQILGGRDHSTVLHGWERARTEMERLPQLKASIRAVRQQLASRGAGASKAAM